eukprot:gene7107-9463_t
MAMAGIVIVLAVGAALRVERHAHLAHVGAQPLQHVDDDVIVANQDAVAVDLGRQVAVAEMPGQPRERRGVAAAHLDEILVRGLDLDIAALLQLQAIALVQHHGLDKVQQEVETAIAQDAQAPAVAIVEQEGDGV